MQKHGDAFDADAEGPSAPDFGVDVSFAQDVGVDHAGAEDFDPTGLFAEPTTFLSAEDAGDIDFDAGFGEGEEAGAEADFGVFSEEGLGEEFEDSAQVGEVESFFDVESLDLMEHGAVCDVVVASVDGAWCDDSDGGLVTEHGADLYRACVGAQEGAVFEHEGVLHVAGGVVSGEVECLEVEVIPFGLGALGDFKAHLQEDVLDLSLSFLEGVFGAEGRGSSREGEVDFSLFEVGGEFGVADFLFDVGECFFEFGSDFVDEGAELWPFLRGEFFHVLHVGLHGTFASEETFLCVGEGVFIFCVFEGLDAFGEEFLEFAPDEIGGHGVTSLNHKGMAGSTRLDHGVRRGRWGGGRIRADGWIKNLWSGGEKKRRQRADWQPVASFVLRQGGDVKSLLL